MYCTIEMCVQEKRLHSNICQGCTQIVHHLSLVCPQMLLLVLRCRNHVWQFSSWFSSSRVLVLFPRRTKPASSQSVSSPTWLSTVVLAPRFRLLVHLVAFFCPLLRFFPVFFPQAVSASPVEFALSCEFPFPGRVRPLALSVYCNHADCYLCVVRWSWGHSWGKQASLEMGSLLCQPSRQTKHHGVFGKSFCPAFFQPLCSHLLILQLHPLHRPGA